MEEQWLEKYKKTESGHGGSSSGGWGKGRRRGRGCGSGGGGDSQAGMNAAQPGSDDTCKRCGKKGHWAKDCRGKPKQERLMHLVTGIRSDGCWTSVRPTMSGSRAAFADLDAGITGSVRFGDGSVAQIEGIGTVLFSCKNGEHRTLPNVYYLPRLTANIISVGQLDEGGYQVLVEDRVMRIRDEERHLLAKIPRSVGQLYVLDVTIARLVCLVARTNDDAWVWHAQFGHLHFTVLRKMARDGLVRGLPLLTQVEQVCEACLVGKQCRTPFPK